MRARRLDASAVGAIAFRTHAKSHPADDTRSGRTENACESPARSLRPALSVRSRMIAANGDSSNTGNYVSLFVRQRTQDASDTQGPHYRTNEKHRARRADNLFLSGMCIMELTCSGVLMHFG